jgi:hypothetical protein
MCGVWRVRMIRGAYAKITISYFVSILEILKQSWGIDRRVKALVALWTTRDVAPSKEWGL